MFKSKLETNKSVRDNVKKIKETNKSTFNKKKWREKKYSNKFKVAEWEKRREKAVLRQYYKELKKDPLYSKSVGNVESSCGVLSDDNKETGAGVIQAGSVFTVTEHPNSEPTVQTSIRSDVKKNKKWNCYEAARAEVQRRNEEKQRRIEERIEKKREMQVRLNDYKKKRADRFRVLSKKNHKGQPLMEGRLQLLYQQVKQAVG